ncbi:MAG: hypothetical protein ABI862_09910 [Ilumatobacteraceae bacterium]
MARCPESGAAPPFWPATQLGEQLRDAVAAKTLAEAPLPLKVIYYTTRRRYARLAARAFGS